MAREDRLNIWNEVGVVESSEGDQSIGNFSSTIEYGQDSGAYRGQNTSLHNLSNKTTLMSGIVIRDTWITPLKCA
jgi:hypothetical protein